MTHDTTADGRAELLARRQALRAELAEIDARLGRDAEFEGAPLASLLDEVPVGVWSISARTLRTLYVNPALLRITGRSREEFPIERGTLIPWMHPDDQEAAAAVRAQTFERGRGEHVWRIVRPDGEIRYTRFEAHAVYGGDGKAERLDVLLTDITEQHLAEEALRTNERRFRRILERSWDLAWIADADRGRRPLSGMGRDLAGWKPEEVLAIPLDQLVHPDDQPGVQRAWADAAARPGVETRHEFRVRHKDGGWVWVEGAVMNLLDDPDVGAFVGHTRDVDARKRSEAALAAANTDLERRIAEATASLTAANQELLAAARSKDAFFANMSHELRTPLNAVLGLSEALQEGVYGGVSEKQRGAMRKIEQSGRHLLSLISDILDLSKIEAGKGAIEIGPVAVGEVCRAALALIEGAARHKQISVSTQISNGFAVLLADERKLKQILVNLLDNAVKFTPEGGAAGLEVNVSEAEETVTFTVWDSGVGISPEDLPRLFHPFVQLDSSLSRAQVGSGLGLSLVRGLADLHGGSVVAESELGKGSRFTVRLPLRRRAEPVSSRGTPCALVVEDSAPVAEQIARYLGEMGVETVVHEHAAGVVDRAAELQPSVILLDILLPAETGWRVLAELKADARTSHIPVIVVSVLERREQSLSLGAVEHVQKPLERDRLLAAVARATGGRSSLRPALIASASAAEPEVEEPPRRRVLVAEDDEVNVISVIDFLRAKGYDVFVARDGREAVGLARELSLDAILMDIQMPVMDGLAAIRTLKADPVPAVRRVPIIALTALAMTGDREKCLEAGADQYLTKPVSLKKLAQILEEVLARRA